MFDNEQEQIDEAEGMSYDIMLEQQAQTIKELQKELTHKTYMARQCHAKMDIRDERIKELQATIDRMEDEWYSPDAYSHLSDRYNELQAKVERIENLAAWGLMSAAMEDPSVCQEMKDDIDHAFRVMAETPAQSLSAIRNEVIEECLDYLLGLFWGHGTKNKETGRLFILVNDYNEGETFDGVAKAIRNLPYPKELEV